MNPFTGEVGRACKPCVPSTVTKDVSAQVAWLYRQFQTWHRTQFQPLAARVQELEARLANLDSPGEKTRTGEEACAAPKDTCGRRTAARPLPQDLEEEDMSMPGVKIAHFSDIHLDGSDEQLNRFTWLIEDAVRRGADHIVIAGDLLEHGEVDQLDAVQSCLEQLDLWDADRTSIVPGNHDIIGGTKHHNRLGALADTDAKRKTRHQRFIEFFSHLSKGASHPHGARYPLGKTLADATLVCLDTTDPTTRMRGQVGQEQLASACRMIKRAVENDRTAIVVMHHRPIDVDPQQMPAEYQFFMSLLQDSMNLTGADDIVAALADAGAATILCGHWHVMDEREFDARSSGVRVLTQGRSGGVDQDETPEGGSIRHCYNMLRVNGGSVVCRSVSHERREIDAAIRTRSRATAGVA